MSSSIELKDKVNFDDFSTLVCIDGSYVIYHTLFSTVNQWMKESPHADMVEDIDCDSNDFEQIDITQYADFLDMAKGKLIETMLRITNMVKDFNSISFSKTYGQMLLVLDPPHGSKHRSWRYFIYPEYKGQRAAAQAKKPFVVWKAFSALLDILSEDGIFEKRFNFRLISANNAEADDIIATIFTSEESKTFKKYLIASDHDYLQLSDITQMTLEGKQVEIEQPYPDIINLTPDDYLLAKIITGDTSDNITQVFNRVGYKTAVKKYVSNPQFLAESLSCDQVAMDKFKRNTKLIDFKMIPKKIRAIARNAVAR